MRKALEQQAERLGIADSVVFLGTRPHEEIALWMNAAECLCLPSRSEGMPNVVLEALASDLPVVTTDAGACPEMLKEEPDSIVVPLSDETSLPARLAEALKDVLEQGRVQKIEKQESVRTWNDVASEILKRITEDPHE